jgi:hypothetical protein
MWNASSREVANLEVAIDRIVVLGDQDQVLDLGPPDALQADRNLSVGDRLRDDGEERAARGLDQGPAVDLDHEAEHIRSLAGELAWVGEGDLALDQSLSRFEVDEEGFGTQAGEDAHAVRLRAPLIMDGETDRLAEG